MLVSVPVHTFLKQLRYDFNYGSPAPVPHSPRGLSALAASAQALTLADAPAAATRSAADFDFKVHTMREQLDAPFGCFAVELTTRQDPGGSLSGLTASASAGPSTGIGAALHAGLPRLVLEPSRSNAMSMCCQRPVIAHKPAAPMPIRVQLPSGARGFSFNGVPMMIPGSPPPQAFSLHRSNGAMGARSPPDSTFAGSFEESLLSGHAGGASFSVVRGFMADVGVSARGAEANEKLRMPPHVRVPFDGVFYHFDQGTPYVGTIPLEEKGYRVPARGLLQVTIFNPAKTPLKTFLVNFDLTEMPCEHKTFLRQKITHPLTGKLVYAVHLRFSCPKARHFYLCKKIKVIFPNRVPDDADQLRVAYDVPKDPPYFPY